MLRAFLARLGLGRSSPDQLELGLGASGVEQQEPNAPLPASAPGVRRRKRTAPRQPRSIDESPHDAPRTLETAVEPAADKPSAATQRERVRQAGELLTRLRAFGLREIDTLRLTQNRATMVSFRGRTLRVHAAFVSAPEDVQRAIAVFVSGRGAARRAARAVILGHRIERTPHTARRSPSQHPDDAALAARLTAEHARLNQQHFGGALRPVSVRVSRRMKSRLGHFAPGGERAGDIVISRRHIRRHGWPEAFETLLHEMVHQWQEENSLPLDHGAAFRRKAREVGVTPSAKRILR